MSSRVFCLRSMAQLFLITVGIAHPTSIFKIKYESYRISL